MENSAIVLAGGFSKRFGQDKALLLLGTKPLVVHVLDRIANIANERLVVVNTEEQRTSIQRIAKNKANVLVDEYKTQTPLAGAYTGFNHAKNEYALLLSCDTPFINSEIARLLLETCTHKEASIPRWPEGYMEPLQAAYHVKSACAAAKIALDEGKLDMNAMITRLRNVRYISTLVLQHFDPRLNTFFNINTRADLKRAETLLKSDFKR